MARFDDARDLETYIEGSMPWWDPGSLTPEQAMAVTAHLLRQRKAVPRDLELSEANLSAFRPAREVPDRPDERVLVIGATALLLAAAGGFVMRRSYDE
jgi:hypothetical protein